MCRIEHLEIFDEFEEWNIMQVSLNYLYISSLAFCLLQLCLTSSFTVPHKLDIGDPLYHFPLSDT